MCHVLNYFMIVAASCENQTCGLANQAVQAKNIARDWKLWHFKIHELYYP